MKITKGHGFRINVGNYESVEVSAHVTIEDGDLWAESDLKPADPVARMNMLRDIADRALFDALQADIQHAESLCGNAESVVLDPNILRRPPEPADQTTTPRRITRRSN